MATESLPTIESIPLLTASEPVDEAETTHLKAKKRASLTPNLPENVEAIETPYGIVSATLQGDPRKPAIVTYHDVGMNYRSCFDTFMSDPNMMELLPLFYWVHIDAPGQENGAKTLPVDYRYPSINELAEQVGLVVEYLRLGYILGLGVGAGANVLTRYAILSPDHVRGLILINLSTDGLSWGNLSYYTNKLVSWLLKTKRLQETVEKYFMSQSLTSAQSDNDLAATYHLYFQQQNPHNLSLFLQSYSRRSPIFIELAQEVKCQWLFIVSGEAERSKDVVELNYSLGPSRSTILELYECSHLVLVEHPEKIATSFRLFLQGLGHAVTLGVTPTKSSSTDLSLRGVSIYQRTSIQSH